MKSFIHVLCHATFWIWNLSFLTATYFGLLPVLGWDAVQAMLDGTIPPTFTVSLVGILLIPLACTVVGWFRLRKHPVLLMRLFYGVEAPLFTLCLLRLFLIREMTPASIQVLGSLLLCILTFGLELLVGYAAYRRGLAWLQMISHSLVLITGLYVGALLTLYTVPVLCTSLYHFLQFGWLREVSWILQSDGILAIWWGLLFLFLFGFSCTLFVAMPFVMVNLYVRSWGRIFSAFQRQQGQRPAWITTGGVAIATLFTFIILQNQPQTYALEALENPPQTEGDRQALVAQSDSIRAGLVNAYLSPYRYLSPWEESNQLRELYRSVFNLSQPQAQFWQDFHNRLISPFLYKGHRDEVAIAADRYAQFFDTPIQKAERSAIQQALQATVNRGETQAGLLDLDQRIVQLVQQEVTVQVQGDWAEVTIEERYENPTRQDQEIFYAFTLPESAVITGVWLQDGEQWFPFVVSPRGAAQQVYTGEVERSNTMQAEDPALLEQVGPRQYRLRVFPIPQQVEDQPGQLQLRMTYQVMQQADGWPLPQLTEKRNIFWTADTVHRRNDDAIQLSNDEWFEATIPAQQPQQPATHRVTLPEGYQVSAQPLMAETAVLPSGQHFAVVLDRSRSMSTHQSDWQAAWQQLEAIAPDNDLDLYLTSAPGVAPQRLDDLQSFNPADVTFYGSLQPAEMLHQFDQLRDQTVYDAILVVTDEGSYELSEPSGEVPELTAPLWMVHLGGVLPAAYDDDTLQALQGSRGGVATEVTEVLHRIATEAALGEAIATVSDGYVWTVEPLNSAPINSESSASQAVALLVTNQVPHQVTQSMPGTADEQGFEPFAARQLILKQSREGDLTELAQLDAVHAIAKRTEIVTPYSSMLVLVNDRQRELLRQAEAAGDRFQREVEDGQDQLTQPNNPLNAVSVPEPGNIVGLGGVAIALIVLKRQSRRPKRQI